MSEIVMLSPVAQEIRDALASRYTLVPDTSDLTDPRRFRVAMTNAVNGANAATMARFPALRLLGSAGVGLDKIDMDYAATHGIRVANTPDAVRTDTADAAVALLFATVRRVSEADRFVRAGHWGPQRMPPSRRVTGMKIGIVGLGAIGVMVASRLTGLGLEVAYTGPRQKPGISFPHQPSLIELARWCDVLILCCPGGPATLHLVSSDVLAALGPRSYLINVARGSVVDEAALLAALESKSIAGAGLDVFAEEPGLNPRFLPLENAVLMPHYAAVTQQARDEIAATLLAAAMSVLG